MKTHLCALKERATIGGNVAPTATIGSPPSIDQLPSHTLCHNIIQYSNLNCTLPQREVKKLFLKNPFCTRIYESFIPNI